MSNRVSHIHTSPAKRAVFRMSFIAVLTLAATVPVSCASVEEELSSNSSPAESEDAKAVKVARTHKSYAYQTADNLPVAFAQGKVRSGASEIKALGSSAYICSPSGFGQLARCILR